MTESGEPLENALAERVNGILKTEWLDKRPLRNWSETQAYVEQVIGLYNTKASSKPQFSDAGSGASLRNRDPTQVEKLPVSKQGEGGVRPLPAGAESQGIAGNGSESN